MGNLASFGYTNPGFPGHADSTAFQPDAPDGTRRNEEPKLTAAAPELEAAM